MWTTREVNHVAAALDSCSCVNHDRGPWQRGNPYSLDDARRLFPSSCECDSESRGCRICPAGHKQRCGHVTGLQHYVSDIDSTFGMTYRWPSQFCTEPSIYSGVRFALFGLSLQYYSNVIMSVMASQITGVSIVYVTSTLWGNSSVTGGFLSWQWRGALMFSLICAWTNG